jgi:hypothetical protein
VTGPSPNYRTFFLHPSDNWKVKWNMTVYTIL